MGFHAELNGLDLHSPSRETVVGGTGDLAALTCVKVIGIGDFFPKVEPANGETEKVAGIVVTAITEGITGSMWTVGRLSNINTSQWSPGTLLYADTSGQLNVSPTNTILKAVCLEQHSASGAVYVYNTISMDNLDVSSLNDVGAITPSAGDVLSWDGASWSSTALSGVGAHINLSSLANVGALTPSAGDVMVYDGANWSATALSGVGALFALSSVVDVCGGASAGDILKWDGTTWNPASEVGGGGGTLLRSVNVTADYTHSQSENVVFIATTGTSITLSITDPIGLSGVIFRVKLIEYPASATGAVLISSTALIDGCSTFTYSYQGESVSLFSDGDNYFIV